MTAPSRRVGIGIGVAVALVVAVGIGWTVLGDDDDPNPSGASGLDDVELPDPITDQSSDLVDEIVALLAGRADLRYHATYAATGDAALLGGEITIQEFRADGRLRSDTLTVGEEGTTETRTIAADDEVVACARLEGEDWACSVEPAVAEGEVEGQGDTFLGSVADQLVGVAVTETDTTSLDGRDARCFSFDTEDGPGELCLNERGIPLLVVVGSTRLTLTGLDEDVPGDAFTPPAEPTATTG